MQKTIDECLLLKKLFIKTFYIDVLVIFDYVVLRLLKQNILLRAR